MNDVVYVWPYVEWGGVQVYFLGLMAAYARKEYFELGATARTTLSAYAQAFQR